MRILIAATLLGATTLGGMAYAAQTTAPAPAPMAAQSAPTKPAGPLTRAQFLDHASKRFDRLDANRDGTLTVDERKAGRKFHGRRGGMRAMTRADTNGDGRISRAEHTAMSTAMFQRRDRNGDGVIDASERGGRMAGPAVASDNARVTRADFEKRAAERFARMDANGDGFIDAGERARPHAGGRDGQRPVAAAPR